MTVGAQIPAVVSLLPSAFGCKKFELDPLGDHVSPCTTHSQLRSPMTGQLNNLLTCHSSHNPQGKDTTGGQDPETSTLPPTWLMLWGRCPWFLTCTLHMSVGKVALTSLSQFLIDQRGFYEVLLVQRSKKFTSRSPKCKHTGVFV